jgi:hypothetical protein
MINSIVFSKDRSMQLDLFLRSIDIHAKDIFNINVLYKHSNEEFKKEYELLQERFKNINFIEETNFKEQVIHLMQTDLEFSCFFTDDDIFYNDIQELDVVECLKNDDVFCFSFKLGKDIKKCERMKCDNVIITEKEENSFIWWNWTKHYLDFGFPLDFQNVFRTKELFKLIKKTIFNDKDSLVENLQMFDNYPKELMSSYKNSVIKKQKHETAD